MSLYRYLSTDVNEVSLPIQGNAPELRKILALDEGADIATFKCSDPGDQYRVLEVFGRDAPNETRTHLINAGILFHIQGIEF